MYFIYSYRCRDCHGDRGKYLNTTMSRRITAINLELTYIFKLEQKGILFFTIYDPIFLRPQK